MISEIKKYQEGLYSTFSLSSLHKSWEEVVRQQLRDSPITDLFDHFEFHIDIYNNVKLIQNLIISGQYKVGNTLNCRLEKKLGIYRDIVVPNPSDLLVLQVLVENFYSLKNFKEPSKNAFFIKDRRIGDLESEYEYGIPARKEENTWSIIQDKIYSLAEKFPFIVVTDIANFYDSIQVLDLKNSISKKIKKRKIYWDFYFKVIQDISPISDYNTEIESGLPVVNIESIRWLAHQYIFEIDSYIKSRTSDSFVRWMDDFMIGVSSKQEGIEILTKISEKLKKKGLNLNTSKTKIIAQENFLKELNIEEHKKLDKYIIDIQDGKKLIYVDDQKLDPYKEFLKTLKNRNGRSWDKVVKRYITLFGRIKSNKILQYLPELFEDHPELRYNLTIYLNSIGYSPQAALVVLDTLSRVAHRDDVSMHRLCKTIVNWRFPINKETDKFINKFDELLQIRRNDFISFYNLLIFRSKYKNSEELLKFILDYKLLWSKDSFAIRQVTSVLSRLHPFKREIVENLLFEIQSMNLTNSSNLATFILKNSNLKNMPTKAFYYLFSYNNKSYTYPHAKFFVLCSYLNSKEISNEFSIQSKIKNYIKDEYHKKIITENYGIQF